MSSIIPSILPNPDPGFKVIVTKEEFNLFHNVDRQLFIRLVVELGRDISESINVMAFLMCIEMITKEFDLVAKILQHWPNVMLNRLADEAVFILDCIASFPYPNDCVREKKFPLIQHILHHNVTFEFFHEKRLELITDVTKFINEVCIRAFTDIIEHMIYNGVAEQQELYLANLHGTASLPTHMLPQAAYYTPNDSPMVPQQIDDRTLFMTFSRGYPVSENELRDFFSREFGDIIERVIMQEVNYPEHPLYARLVVCREGMNVIDYLLEYNPRLKFIINGKHVWVRKYFSKPPPPPYEAGTSWSFP